ncbi:MAG TPA: CoA-binding protein [Candidatus Deferrimicrobium sp.]|nr:CoA-binding protein [Candidatus Deferrimicrobium sp.]
MIDLDPLFYPKNAVALIGVSDTPIKGASAFLYALKRVYFPNPIFCINKHKKEVLFNEKAYSSILDIPKEIQIDYAVIGVPAKDVPEAIKECSERNVKFVTIFSSGFSELETELGIQLEKETLENAKNGPRIVGPNCLGVFCRDSKLTITEILEINEQEGRVAFLSQSGGHTSSFYYIGENRGFPFNKLVSLGNQCDLTIQDFIEYFVNDEKIHVISCYLERIKRVDEFLKILHISSQKKPIIFWKGGSTKEGIIAAASHTGAIQSSYNIFKSAINQHGGIIADSMEELADLTLGALHLTHKKLGVRVGIVVPGGGSCVEMTDEAAKFSLKVPELIKTTRNKIQDMIQDVNTNTRNPVDLGVFGWIPKVFQKTISFIAEDPNIDVIIFYLMTERIPSMAERLNDRALEKSFLKRIKTAIRSSDKAFICILPNFIVTDSEITRMRKELILGLSQLQIPYFPSMERAANVIVKLLKYQRFIKSNGI